MSLVLGHDPNDKGRPVWTQTSAATDNPGFSHLNSSPNNVCLGSHLIIWNRRLPRDVRAPREPNDMLYRPTIVNPAACPPTTFDYDEPSAFDTSGFFFAPGLTGDSLVFGRLAGPQWLTEVYSIEDGQLIGPQLLAGIDFVSIRACARQSDSCLVLFVIPPDALLATGTSTLLPIVVDLATHRTHNLLTAVMSDAVVVRNGIAVHWSREMNLRVTYRVYPFPSPFDEDTTREPIVDRMAPDEAIIAVSTHNCLTFRADTLRLYDSSGRCVNVRRIGPLSNFRGCVSAHASDHLAFVYSGLPGQSGPAAGNALSIAPENVAVFYHEGVLTVRLLDHSTDHTRMILYRDTLYAALSAGDTSPYRLTPVASLPPISVAILDLSLSSAASRPPLVTGQIPGRQLRISSTLGWVLETIRAAADSNDSVTRRIFFLLGHKIDPWVVPFTRTVPLPWRNDAPAIQPFLYRARSPADAGSGGSVDASTSILAWFPSPPKSILRPASSVPLPIAIRPTYDLELQDWNDDARSFTRDAKNADRFVRAFSLRHIRPVPGDILRWSRTPKWIVLTVGPRAYVWDHFGLPLPPSSNREELFRPGDDPCSFEIGQSTLSSAASFLGAYGHAEGLWLLVGIPSPTIGSSRRGDTPTRPIVTSVRFWNGADDLIELAFTGPENPYTLGAPFRVAEAAATSTVLDDTTPPLHPVENARVFGARPRALHELVIRTCDETLMSAMADDAFALDRPPLWLKFTYDAATRQILHDVFMPDLSGKHALAAQPADAFGRVAFAFIDSAGSPAVGLYTPGTAQMVVKFNLYLSSPSTPQGGPATVRHEQIKRIRCTGDAIWVCSSSAIYRLMSAPIMDLEVPYTRLPSIPVYSYSVDKPAVEYQVPDVIWPVRQADGTAVSRAVPRALALSPFYAWRSDRPLLVFNAPIGMRPLDAVGLFGPFDPDSGVIPVGPHRLLAMCYNPNSVHSLHVDRATTVEIVF